ncbi:MAG TPA: Mur ligase family protein [Candidatus Saccharimonadales bacterium]|nr:Mur ligase family protein [Candidatus Saccharimonadales bacterium]
MQFRQLKPLLALYSPTFAASLVAELARRRYSGWRLLYWFWHTKTFQTDAVPSETGRPIVVFLGLGMVAQLAIGIGLLVEWARFGTAGALAFGVALVLSYPLLWTHVVVVLAWVWNLLWAVQHPKKAGRAAVCVVLEWQVRRLRRRHHVKVVAVVGSVGKTSTKLAIADLLAASGLRVRHQVGNYNDRVTVPLVFFGLTEPNIYNVIGWLKAFGVAQSEVALPYPYDVVVLELGTDGPGQLAEFAYLKPDLTVVTAVAPEHMEFFGSLDGVAAEELSVFAYSKQVLVNADDIAGEYLAGLEFVDYSLTSEQARYHAQAKPSGLKGQHLTVQLPKGELTAEVRYLGQQGAKTALAAAATANLLGVTAKKIASGLPQLAPFSGRMQILDGVKNTTLIDDTYNASPKSVKAALDVLYAAKTKQRLAILGSMNELGDFSRQAHEEVGEYCDPKKLAVVVTVGHDAKKWLAPAARDRGCHVQVFLSPHDAGAYVSGKMAEGAVVLAKGSQNGVFAEEALKPLLADPTDAEKLVRQSPHWLNVKARQFNG